MEQIQSNTVSAVAQTVQRVFFPHTDAQGVRILLLGNSITLHGLCPEIGWNHEWGMAASAEENDYVHVLIRLLRGEGKRFSLCFAQVSKYEARYREEDRCEILPLYRDAKDFAPDILVVRAVENMSAENFDREAFCAAYQEIIRFFAPQKETKIIVTTSFWKHPGDAEIQRLARENGYAFVYLGDLGERDDMKAVGLFEHSGVQAHPGDLGMRTIAERINEKIREAYDDLKK